MTSLYITHKHIFFSVPGIKLALARQGLALLSYLPIAPVLDAASRAKEKPLALWNLHGGALGERNELEESSLI